jgi:competence protein ComEC
VKNLLLFYLLLVLIVCVRLFFFYSNQPVFSVGEKVEFETTVSSTPKFFFNHQTLWVNISATQGVLLKLTLDNKVTYGDKIKVSGRLESLLLTSGNAIFTIDHPVIEHINRENTSVLAVIYSIRQNIIDYFKLHLDSASAGLLLGIVFGIKDNLPPEFLDQIQKTGVMHVVAASGMNVTMISGFLFYLFILFFKRRQAIALAIAGIVFYVALAGFEASIVRAAIMGIIVFSAQILGKQKTSSHILFLTVILMLFLWPEFLLSIGFQLSVAATMGILFIPPLFSRFTNRISEVFIVTIAAQITTLPILIVNFGNYSLFSIIVNALVLWTVPILTILGMIAAFFVFVLPFFSSFLLYLTMPFLLFFQEVVSIFANLGGEFYFPEVAWQFSIAYYLAVAAIVLFLNEKISRTANP